MPPRRGFFHNKGSHNHRTEMKETMTTRLITTAFTILLAASTAYAAVPEYGPLEVRLRTHPTTPEHLSPGDTMSGASPAVNDAGQIAVRVNVAANSQGHGLWVGDEQGGEVVFELGDDLDSDFMSSSVDINGLGEAVFERSQTSSDNGLWVYDSATGETVRATTQPVGTSNWSSPRIDDDGIIGFRAGFGTGHAFYSVDPATNDVKMHAAENSVDPSPWFFLFTPSYGNGRTITAKVWRTDEGNPEEIRRFADDGTSELLAETTATDPGSQFSGFNNSVGINEVGDVAFVAGIAGGGRGVFLYTAGGIVEIAREEPGGPVTEIEFFAPDVNDAGLVVFRAFDENGDRAVWIGDGVELIKIARRGDTVETSIGLAQINRPDSDIVFGGNPAINDDGTVVFSADLVAADNINTWFGRALLAASSKGEEPVPGVLDVSPLEHDFGEVDAGDSDSVVVTVANAADKGAEALTLNLIALSGTGFAVSGGDCVEGGVLDPGAGCSVEVTFSPGKPGDFAGELGIEADDGVDSQTAAVVLSGTGVQEPGELGVSPQSLDFGGVVVGDSGSAAVTVSNLAAEGHADLELTRIEIIVGRDVFAIDATGTDCGKSLPPQTSCTVTVNYMPDEVAVQNGILRISAEGKDAVSVSLSGSGIELEPDIFEDRFEGP